MYIFLYASLGCTLFRWDCVCAQTHKNHRHVLNAFHYPVTDKRISFLVGMSFIIVKALLIDLYLTVLSFNLTEKLPQNYQDI